VLSAMLGQNMYCGSIAKLEISPFARADLEFELLMVDDDMRMEALPQTNNIKTIVTSETPMDMERKGKQSYQGILYARMIGLGNGSLYALYDRSVGFFRRQIILRTKERDPGRIDDPCLAEKLREESEGIFLWCLEGLTRLQKNSYRFTVSTRAAKNLNESVREGNNIIDFLSSQGYIRFHPEAKVPSKELYAVYKGWCEDNTVIPVAAKSFTGYLKEEQTAFGISYDNNVPLANGRRARGFHGIECARLGRFETEAG
jgi:putative DNA primase/helicase